jgi:hypothetical protein
MVCFHKTVHYLIKPPTQSLARGGTLWDNRAVEEEKEDDVEEIKEDEEKNVGLGVGVCSFLVVFIDAH